MKVIIELNSLCSIENVDESDKEIKINLSDYTCVVNIDDLKLALKKMTEK